MKRAAPARASTKNTAPTEALQTGLVVGSFGRHCLVETASGQRVICHPRGKKSQVVVGDRVQWLATQDEGTIEKIEERRNLFYRQDDIRTKSFAANLDRVLILIAAEPEFSESQLSRALIAAEAQQIQPIIALNKSDLGEPFKRAWARMDAYRRMGYEVLPLSLKAKPSEDRALLWHTLQGHTTLVLGPSGAGKSTLINLLVPGALVLTQEISQALNSGKHTTTSTTWYWVREGADMGSGEGLTQGAAQSATLSTAPEQPTALIDSPGFQEFGLNHVDAMNLATLMPDFKRHIAQCKFYNCTHLHEPGCGIISSTKNPAKALGISAERYFIYSNLFAELSGKRLY